MKNLFKLLSIIAFVAVVGISMEACGSKNSDRKGTISSGSDTPTETVKVPLELVGKWFGEDDCLAFEITANGIYIAYSKQYTANVKGDTLLITDDEGDLYWAPQYKIKENSLTTYTTVEWGRMEDYFTKNK